MPQFFSFPTYFPIPRPGFIPLLAGAAFFAAVMMCARPASAMSEIKFPAEVIQGFTKEGIGKGEWSAYALPIEPTVQRRTVAFAQSERDLQNPASVTKLFTTGYAIDTLGTGFSYKTSFMAESEPENGVLRGNLYIKGSGDPVFLSSDLWESLRRLKARGVRKISGSIVLDRTAFLMPGQTESPTETEDFDETAYRAYNAVPDALLLNHGAMGLDISVVEGRVRVSSLDAPSNWAFVSNLTPAKGECGSWKNGLNVQFKKQKDEVVVNVSGPYATRCGSNRLPIRIAQQDWLWESWIREIWRQLGGEFNGEVISGVTPNSSIALYTHVGKPLTEVIRTVNKWSNNVMARHLELTMTNKPGEFDQKVRAWLNSKGIQTPGWVIENGSGLSRVTRVDSKGLSEYLAYMARRADFPDFFASLPRAGADGTLFRRMKNVDEYAYLKTGSLNGVRTIAGYVRSRNGQLWAIGVMVKGANAGNAWTPMENLVKMLYNKGSDAREFESKESEN